MSLDKAILLIDNSAKDDDKIIYKMNLLARTLKSNKAMPEFLDFVLNFYNWMQGQHPDMIKYVWMGYFKSWVLAIEGTSSEAGWLMDLITQHRISYKGNNPEARKMALSLGNQKANQPEQMQ